LPRRRLFRPVDAGGRGGRDVLGLVQHNAPQSADRMCDRCSSFPSREEAETPSVPLTAPCVLSRYCHRENLSVYCCGSRSEGCVVSANPGESGRGRSRGCRPDHTCLGWAFGGHSRIQPLRHQEVHRAEQ
jgi:hypothetical protein